MQQPDPPPPLSLPFTMLPRCSETPETVVMMVVGLMKQQLTQLHGHRTICWSRAEDTWKVLAVRGLVDTLIQ